MWNNARCSATLCHKHVFNAKRHSPSSPEHYTWFVSEMSNPSSGVIAVICTVTAWESCWEHSHHPGLPKTLKCQYFPHRATFKDLLCCFIFKVGSLLLKSPHPWRATYCDTNHDTFAQTHAKLSKPVVRKLSRPKHKSEASKRCVQPFSQPYLHQHQHQHHSGRKGVMLRMDGASNLRIPLWCVRGF